MTGRFAILDLGTNSARLLVADVSEEGAWQSVVDERIACRLGEGLQQTGQIQASAEQRTTEALRALVQQTLNLGDVTLRVLATHTLRAATNGLEVRERLEKAIEQPIQLISGEQEAALVLRTARSYVLVEEGEPLVAVDLGGGSLEFAVQPGDDASTLALSDHRYEEPLELLSLPLGSVVMSHELPTGIIPIEQINKLRAHVRDILRRDARTLCQVATKVAMAGGTAVCAAAVLGHPAPWTGVHVATAAVEETIPFLAQRTLQERQALPGVGDRADIIVAGMAVLTEALQHLGATHGVVLQHGVREGALLALALGDL